jgi:hypothetical protein
MESNVNKRINIYAGRQRQIHAAAGGVASGAPLDQDYGLEVTTSRGTA